MTYEQPQSADINQPQTSFKTSGPAPLPVKVVLEHLNNVTLEDAREYAMGYLKNKATSATLFYGLFAHGNGYIVEIHEGGEGAAFTPELLRCLNTGVHTKEPGTLQAQLLTGKGKLFVSVTASSLSAMAMPDLSEVPYDLDAKASTQRLEQVIFNHSGRVLFAATRLSLASLVILALALVFKPDAAQITVTPVQAEKLPIVEWVKNTHWPANERPVTVRLNKTTGELEIRTEKLTGQATLKVANDAAQAADVLTSSIQAAQVEPTSSATHPVGAAQ